jgi:sugar-specific transcriptional regulator TrmB
MAENSSNLTGRLVELGMSEREAKVYQALLNKRNATISELQKSSGVPQCKMYEIMGRLVHQGYCRERKVGRSRTFDVVDPRNALFFHLPKRLLIEDLSTLFASSDRVTEPLDYIETLRGNDNIHRRYCQLVKGVSEELLGFGRGPYACDTSNKAEEQDDEEAGILTRGGTVRWVYEINLPEEDWVVQDLRPLQANGAGIRIADTLPIKMMIFDRKTLLVADEEPFTQPGELTMSIIKQRTIVNAFMALFEFFWQQSDELDVWDKKQGMLERHDTVSIRSMNS